MVRHSQVEFYSYDYPMLNGTDIVQELSWTDNGDPNYFGQAMLGIGGVLENKKILLQFPCYSPALALELKNSGNA